MEHLTWWLQLFYTLIYSLLINNIYWVYSQIDWKIIKEPQVSTTVSTMIQKIMRITMVVIVSSELAEKGNTFSKCFASN